MDLELDEFDGLSFDYHFAIGCDEVGRGPLAGPVVGAACIILRNDEQTLRDNDYRQVELVCNRHAVTDSKKINEKKRASIISSLSGIKGPTLKKKRCLQLDITPSLKCFIFIVEKSPRWIEKHNILKSSLQCMNEASNFGEELNVNPEEGLYLIDGKHIPKGTMKKWIPLVKGDSRNSLIALSSIFAKTYRDNLMKRYALRFPQYELQRNFGYPTKRHLQAIKEYGPCPIHRRSFRGVSEFFQ